MEKIFIIGAGQLGSRHLQALAAVKEPLQISVIDPSPESLRIAKERFEVMPPKGGKHSLGTYTDISDAPKDRVDLLIIANCSDTRYQALEKLLNRQQVTYAVLEKILFDRPEQYESAGALLKTSGCKAWVNCSMRQMPIYRQIKETLQGTGRVHMQVSGGLFGLVCNAIHYADYMVYVLGEKEFSVDVEALDPAPVPSKRRNFVELTGTLILRFKDLSECVMTSFAGSDLPIMTQLSSASERFLVRDTEGRVWHTSSKAGWKWEEIDGSLPYQSSLTTQTVEELTRSGTCPLTPFAESSRTHLQLFEPLRQMLKMDNYPFT